MDAKVIQPSFRTILALLLAAFMAACTQPQPPRVVEEQPTAPVVPATSTEQPQPPTLSPTASPTTPPTRTATSSPTSEPPTSTPTPDALALFGAALRPDVPTDLAALKELPRYAVQLWFMPETRLLTGTMQVDFTNRTDAPLSDVAFRLYPNFPRDVFGEGGTVRMDITSVSVEGGSVEPTITAQNTAAILPLDSPLAPRASTTLELTFRATVEPGIDGTWPLPSYYPMLAVHDNDAWRLDVTRFADHVYAESAFYAVDLTVPAALDVIASGSTLTRETLPDDRIRHSIVAGPVREFAFSIGNFVQATEVAAGGVDVHVYAARGSGLNVQEVAQVAARALETFDKRFGPYPYRELDVHLQPGQFDGGDEYPGLIMLYSDAQVDAGTRFVTAHEVAHQWWYGVVGNDIYRQPWLDEAFAQYSAIVYAEDVVGADVAAADYEREIMRRYRGALADGDLPVGDAITSYPNFNVYYRTVYGKGAVFLRTLRTELGDDVFFEGLHTYYSRSRFGIGTTADVRRAFESASGRDLSAIFRSWVGPDE